VARLIHHRSTLDPFLDDSGPSLLRLGSVTLDGQTHSALDASAASDVVLDVGTSDASRLTVPCAVLAPAGARVAFDVTVSGEGRAPLSRSLTIEGAGIGRWHEITLAVPPGRPSIALRTRVLGEPAGVRACWGVPSLTWRKHTRALLHSAAFMLRAHGLAGAARQVRGKLVAGGTADYPAWLASHVPDPAALDAMREAAGTLTVRPRFALVLDGDRATDPSFAPRLEATLSSLDAQVYRDFEVWLPRAAGAHASPDRANLRFLDAAAGDAASRNAVLAASAADYVAMIRAGDRLAPHALFRAADHLSRHSDADVIYSDEDVQEPSGAPSLPRLKPDWSPEYLRARMYLGRLLLVRRTLALRAGGYRERFAGALDYDLALRATPLARAIVHLADVLYHRAEHTAFDREGAHPDAAAALADAFASEGTRVAVVPGARRGVWRARIAVDESPPIAIVIPTDGQSPPDRDTALIVECIRSLRARTSYPRYELVVCDNGNLTAAVRAYLDTVPHRRVTYRWEGAFNFPRKLNFAVAQTDAPFVLLLNDDVEAINADWLTAMLEYAQQPQIGAVGAKLFYPDGRLQHVGVAVGVCGVAAHLLHQHPGGTDGCDGIAVAARNCTAVTGACLLTRRRVYDEVGGFDERLPVDFNDVDFCLRVRQAGYRIVYTPHARLLHRESASFARRRQRPEEIAVMRHRWGPLLDYDPYYNVNYSRRFPDCRLEGAQG